MSTLPCKKAIRDRLVLPVPNFQAVLTPRQLVQFYESPAGEMDDTTRAFIG